MFRKARLAFGIVLVTYVLTLLTVTYVGVYLTYIVFPILAVLALVMIFTQSRSDENNEIGEKNVPLHRTHGAINTGLDSLNNFLGSLDQEGKKLEDNAKIFNEKDKLISAERRKKLDEQYSRLTPEQKKIIDSMK